MTPDRPLPRAGDVCGRCDGTGTTFDEGPERYEWDVCPYFDVVLGLQCDGGILAASPREP